jgi:hypothetical protein
VTTRQVNLGINLATCLILVLHLYSFFCCYFEFLRVLPAVLQPMTRTLSWWIGWSGFHNTSIAISTSQERATQVNCYRNWSTIG